MRILVIGANGGVGRLVTAIGSARRHSMSGLVRRQAPTDANMTTFVGDVLDARVLEAALQNQDAVVFAVGVNHTGPTTLFSDATRTLLPLMTKCGVKRLVCITGVGAGETQGHGGFLYDYIIYPLFTRHRYRDKERQEQLVRESGLEWTIVRPAAFANKAPTAPLTVVTDVAGVVLRRVTREEVATFVLDELESGRFVRQTPFIGHP